MIDDWFIHSLFIDSLIDSFNEDVECFVVHRFLENIWITQQHYQNRVLAYSSIPYITFGENNYFWL